MSAPASPSTIRAPRRAVVLSVFVVLLALGFGLAACAQSAAGSAAASAGEPAGQPVDQPVASAGGDQGKGNVDGGSAGVPLANLAERKIVKTGELTLQVPSVGAAVGELRAIALSLDGYVSDSRTGGERDPATITLRVPADRFDEALTRLHGMDGEVRVEATKDEDVTSSLVDLEARIRNLQASEEQYRVLVGRAQKIDDILAVQSRLDEVRGQIEQLSAQLKHLNGLATLSTITVTLLPASTPVEDAAQGWDPGATFGNAIAALVSAGQALADIGIWLLIVGLPILLVLAVVAWLALRFRLLPRRLGAAPGPTPAADE
jgi:hypothetical protein